MEKTVPAMFRVMHVASTTIAARNRSVEPPTLAMELNKARAQEREGVSKATDHQPASGRARTL